MEIFKYLLGASGGEGFEMIGRKLWKQTLYSDRPEEQQYLSLLDGEYTFEDAVGVLDRIDWDFASFNTQYLTHRFHSYPARFIPQIPLAFIKLFTKSGDTVLDPFCGCGTTLVEALLNNRKSIGNDFNPLAVLIAKVKTTLIGEREFACFQRKIKSLEKQLKWCKAREDQVAASSIQLPKRKISKIFDGEIVTKLNLIRGMLLELEKEGHEELYDFGRVALSSVIWSLVEKESCIDVGSLFLRKVCSMKEQLKETGKIVKTYQNLPEVRLINGDARKLTVETDSVDLVVTSPPYVNALDYYRVHMYNMQWLGMDFGLFKKHEIGGHSHFINNRFRLLSEYLGDMLRSMIEMNRVLKKGKLCVIVVGNSSLEYELIESYKFFSAMAPAIGFRPIKVIYRNIDKTKKYTSADIGMIDDEYILVLQKVDDVKVGSDDEEFIVNVVKEQMIEFSKRIEKCQGSSIRGKKPTKERLLKNIEKINEAIINIPKDIKL